MSQLRNNNLPTYMHILVIYHVLDLSCIMHVSTEYGVSYSSIVHLHQTVSGRLLQSLAENFIHPLQARLLHQRRLVFPTHTMLHWTRG